MNNQTIIVPIVNSIPAFCITNKDVTRINAAQPFILIVVQIGNTKRATEGWAFKLSSADANVTGNVAAEDFVNNATATAGDILRNTSIGFKPRNNKNNGITIKN